MVGLDAAVMDLIVEPNGQTDADGIRRVLNGLEHEQLALLELNLRLLGRDDFDVDLVGIVLS